MKKSELTKLRSQLLEETQRRKRVNELLENELIQEFLKLSNVNIRKLKDDDKLAIIHSILRNFTISETNGIYICTGTFYTDYDICYEDTNYYSRETDFDSKYAEYRTYCDIEDGKTRRASIKLDDLERRYHELSTREFEEKNIVLNPYNSSDKGNGYSEVRDKFFMTAIDQGQAKAKKLILREYPRM